MSNFFHGFIDDQLTSDEYVLYRAHLSWVPVAVHMLPIMMLSGAISGVVWGVTNNIWSGLFSICVCLLVGFLSQLGYIYQILATDIVVTNRRFTYKIGIVTIRDNRESSLSRIDDTDIDMDSIPERVFKYGDITVQTLGGGGKDFYAFKHVARPRLLKQAINEAKDQFAAWGEPSMMFASMMPPAQQQQQQYQQQPYQQQQQQPYPQQNAYGNNQPDQLFDRPNRSRRKNKR